MKFAAWFAVPYALGLGQNPPTTAGQTPQEYERQVVREMEELNRQHIGGVNDVPAAPARTARTSPPTISMKRLEDKLPKKAQALRKEAAKQAKAGNREGAINSLQSVILLAPQVVGPHSELGLLYYESGRIDEATREFIRAAELDPHDADIQVNLGWTLLWQGDAVRANAAAQRAIQMHPRSPRAHLLSGSVMLTNPATVRQGLRHLDIAAESFASK